MVKKVNYIARSLLSKSISFYFLNTVFLLQNTLFAWRACTFENVTFFTLCAMFYSFLTTIIVLWTRSTIIKILFYSLSILICITNVYLYLRFSTKISPNLLLLLGETNQQECNDFIHSHLFNGSSLISLLCLLIIVKVCLFFEKNQYRIKKRIPTLAYNMILICSISGGFFASFFHITLHKCQFTTDIDAWIQEFDLKPMDNFSNLFYSFRDINVMGNEMNYALKQTTSIKKSICTNTDSINLVFVIGESYNKWHSGLYGYNLKTNPILEEEKKNGKVYVFSNAVSPYNLTSKTLRCMLSTNSLGLKEKWHEKPFFPAILRQAGYEVFFWDNQNDPTSRDEWDFSLNSYLHNSEIEKISYTFTNNNIYKLDEDLLNDYITHQNGNSSKRKFIIFHLIGQHIAYYSRFPHGGRFDYFKSDSISLKKDVLSQEARQIIADYDNATRYNDFVIGEIIKTFQNENSIILYLSDHGEEVYDFRDFYGRSWGEKISYNILKYQYEVPFIIWCSNKYIEKNPQKIESIKSALDRPFSTDLIAHLIFNLADIISPYYQPELDIINNSYQCPPRIINDSLDFDNYMETQQKKNSNELNNKQN